MPWIFEANLYYIQCCDAKRASASAHPLQFKVFQVSRGSSDSWTEILGCRDSGFGDVLREVGCYFRAFGIGSGASVLISLGWKEVKCTVDDTLRGTKATAQKLHPIMAL